MVVLSWLESEIHKDTNDIMDGWVADMAWGDFDGGNLEVQGLGLQVDLKQGDVLFMRSRMLAHAVGEVTRGMRYATVMFTHDGCIKTSWQCCLTRRLLRLPRSLRPHRQIYTLRAA